MAIPLWLTKLLVRTRLAQFTPRAQRLTDGGVSFLRYYSDRVLAAPVEELLDPAFIPDAAGPDVIDLNQPAPRVEAGVNFGRFATECWGETSPRGLAELREALAARYQRLDGRSVDPRTELHITHGATGAYTAALEAFVNPRDRVVLFDPSSPLFALGARSRRATIRWVPTTMEEGRSRFQTHDFERAMRGAKLLVLANPGNPTGSCLAEEDFEYIAWIAAAYDVLVYVDQAFHRYQFGERSKSMALMSGADRRVLTAGSATHEFGLGAVRVGWLAGPRHLVRACGLTANLQAPYVPVVCQQAALRALSEPEDALKVKVDRLRGKCDYAVDRLRGMGLEVHRPQGGYFLWASVAGMGLDGRTFATRLFREEQVQVGPGCAFGPGAAANIRISLATDDGRLREGLARMASLVERFKQFQEPPVPRRAEPLVEETTSNEAAIVERPRPAFSRV